MMHGWQSESTDGPKGGWKLELCFFGVVAMVVLITSPQLLDVVLCGAGLVVIVV